MITWLKTNWFLVTAFFSAAAAWGQQQYKVESLEEAVKQNVVAQRQIEDLKERAAKQDERTERMLDMQQQQQRLLEMILQEQRKTTNAVRSQR